MQFARSSSAAAPVASSHRGPVVYGVLHASFTATITIAAAIWLRGTGGELEGLDVPGGFLRAGAPPEAAAAMTPISVPPAVYIVGSEEAASRLRDSINERDLILRSGGGTGLRDNVVIATTEGDFGTLLAAFAEGNRITGDWPEQVIVDLWSR